MKKFLFPVLLSLFTLPNTALALTPYFSTGVTSGMHSNGRHASTSYDTLWTLTAGVHYALTPNISMRNGVEYAMGDYSFHSTLGSIDYEYDTKTKIYLGNAIIDFRPTGFSSSIYAGISAGVTNYKTELSRPYSAPAESHSTFTYGVSAGISLNLISGLFADVGIRYLTTADAGSDGNIVTTAGLHMGF